MFGETSLLFAYFEACHYNSSFPTKIPLNTYGHSLSLVVDVYEDVYFISLVTDTWALHVIFLFLLSLSIPMRSRPRRAAAAAARRQPTSSNPSPPAPATTKLARCEDQAPSLPSASPLPSQQSQRHPHTSGAPIAAAMGGMPLSSRPAPLRSLSALYKLGLGTASTRLHRSTTTRALPHSPAPISAGTAAIAELGLSSLFSALRPPPTSFPPPSSSQRHYESVKLLLRINPRQQHLRRELAGVVVCLASAPSLSGQHSTTRSPPSASW